MNSDATGAKSEVSSETARALTSTAAGARPHLLDQTYLIYPTQWIAPTIIKVSSPNPSPASSAMCNIRSKSMFHHRYVGTEPHYTREPHKWVDFLSPATVV